MKIEDELLEWLEEEENIFVDEFLVIKKRISIREIGDLKQDKDFLKKYNLAKDIEKTKLVKFSAGDRLNIGFVKYYLANQEKDDNFLNL